MDFCVTPNWIRNRDNYTIETIGIPSMVLMERAAKAVADIVLAMKLPAQRQVYILCGRGNNGGDGFAIGRILHDAGCTVHFYCPFHSSQMTVETKAQYQIVRALHLPIEKTLQDREGALIIDALFGSGLSRPIEGELFQVIQEVNTWSGYKLSVDIPSGICGESGQVLGIAFLAEQTVALGYKKIGTILYPGRSYTGLQTLADIGLYRDEAMDSKTVAGFTYTSEDIDKLLPPRSPLGHKGSFGKVLIIGGSETMGGAAYLSAKAAYLMGAGLVQVYTHHSNRLQLQTLLPEAIVTTYDRYEPASLDLALAWATTISIGSGLSRTETAKKIFYHTLDKVNKTCIVDGDGLYFLGKQLELLRKKAKYLILTPHVKEMTYLVPSVSIEQIKMKSLTILTTFINDFSVICALKDACTIVGQAKLPLYVNESGSQAMAKGGSGDVLAGIITGLVAQGMDPFTATSLAVYIHGLAGEEAALHKGSYGVLASDIIHNINSIINKEESNKNE